MDLASFTSLVPPTYEHDNYLRVSAYLVAIAGSSTPECFDGYTPIL
jgi:hypothetical protein